MKTLVLLGSDGKEYRVPIEIRDGQECYIIPKDWVEEKVEAFIDYIYPNGHITIVDNSIKIP